MSENRITPEVIEALANLRKFLGTTNVWLGQQFDILDNAGVFAGIDGAVQPERVGKCTCSELDVILGEHGADCPGDTGTGQ